MSLYSILSRRTRIRRQKLAAAMLAEIEAEPNPEHLQLQKLNAVWKQSCSNIPYYQDLVAKGLPSSFESLDDFASKVPIFTKSLCQSLENRAFAQIDLSSLQWSATGGSTGEPMRFPRLGSELTIHEKSEWYLRSLIGITPDDAYFKIWGHSHLQGNGIGRLTNQYSRKIKDKALKLTRVSAYDLSREAVQRGLKKLQRSKSTYVLGYSKALEIYAEELLKNNLTQPLPTLKGVIAAAEGFSTERNRTLIEEAFGCQVFMEYGSMETGSIAQEISEGEYHVAWNNYFLEAVPTNDGDHKILVTALYPRAFPLFRYDLGDLVAGFDQPLGIRHFTSINGREYPLIKTPNGNQVHPLLVSSCLKEFEEVSFFQVGMKGDEIAQIYVSLRSRDREQIIFGKLRERLLSIDAGLVSIPFQIISQHRLTPAGKRPTFIQI
jgi:phenylacetate-coenzyme A ligase PaaK-like adenylate-forming protein